MAAMTNDTIPLFSVPAAQSKKCTAAVRIYSNGGVMPLSLAERACAAQSTPRPSKPKLQGRHGDKRHCNYGFAPSTAACGEQVVAGYTFQFIVPWFPQFSAKVPFGATERHPVQH
jgi:hypothetical protein